MVSFLKAKMFGGKPEIVKAGRADNFVIGRTEHDPIEDSNMATAEAIIIRERFEAGTFDYHYIMGLP